MATRTNGLFTKVDRPLPGSAKGGCYIWGSAGPGVDTGVLIDFEGTLYLGNAAIKELAECAGFSLNEEGLQLEYDNAHLQRKVAELASKNADLEDQLNGVSALLARNVKR